MKQIFSAGYWPAFRVRGVPLRLHWTMPIGLLFFTRFRFEPLAWLSMVVLTLCHELGHAFFVRRYRMQMVSIDLHGFGGLCRYEGYSAELEQSIISWGGVLVQLAFLAVALPLRLLLPDAITGMLGEVFEIFIYLNAISIVVNLLPIGGLDGKKAWRFFPLFFRRRARAQSEVERVTRHLVSLVHKEVSRRRNEKKKDRRDR